MTMVPTSWSARFLPPQAAEGCLATLDQAFQAAGLTRAPAAWFGARNHPDFVMGQNVMERAAKQDDDRVTLAYASGAGFSTTTAFLARLWLESGARTIAHLHVWTPVLDFNLSIAGGMPSPTAVLQQLSEAVTHAFALSGNSPLVETELEKTQLTPDQVMEWADAHIQRASLLNPRRESLRLIPAGHRNDSTASIMGDYWVARYASTGTDGVSMTVVNIDDRTGEVKVG